MDSVVLVVQLVLAFMGVKTSVVRIGLMVMPVSIFVLVDTVVTAIVKERGEVVRACEVDIWSMEVPDTIVLLGDETSEGIVRQIRVL